jgi:hypothetical protein
VPATLEDWFISSILYILYSRLVWIGLDWIGIGLIKNNKKQKTKNLKKKIYIYMFGVLFFDVKFEL